MQNKKKTQMYRTEFWTLWEKARVGCFERTACILSIVKQITSPGGMHETSARGWCTGKTQRDQVEREVGGGIGMGNTCRSMADSCQCMTKPLQDCKVISLQLIKINEKISENVKVLSVLYSNQTNKNLDFYGLTMVILGLVMILLF